MAADTIAPQGARSFRRPAAITSWKLWGLPSRALALILCVDLVAAIATCAALASVRWDIHQGERMLLLLALGIGYSEVTTRVERMRRYLASGTIVNITSVWTVAAVLCLSIGYATVVVVLLMLAHALRLRRQKALRPHRLIFTSATVLLSTVCAAVTGESIRSHFFNEPQGAMTGLAVIAALLVFLVVNWVLVVATMYCAMRGITLKELLPGRDEGALELATLVLGTLVAETVFIQPILTPMILLLLLLLQRSAMVSQLEVAATTDSKTGLLNAKAWQEMAHRELLRAQRDQSPAAVLLLDLDHFKLVNDTLGHLAGDAALKAVSDVLKKELRGYDAVARFGGEEFVVFLNDLRVEDARQVAERALSRIRELVITRKDEADAYCTLTASIGLSVYPQHGRDLADLLEAADVALYLAKRSGRDRVCEPQFPQVVQRRA
jgi:diguanylate cyclase (GGDEF)-like protein